MDFSDLLNDKASDLGLFPYFYGQTKSSLLIGPKIEKKLCMNCLKKRLASSSFCDTQAYLHVSKRIRKIIENKAYSLNLSNRIAEIDKKTGKTIFIHHLICVPGCKRP